MLGRLALAAEYFRQSVVLRRQVDGFHASMLSFPLANLGFACWLQGRLDEANDALAEALRDREAAFGPMDTMSYKWAPRPSGRGGADVAGSAASCTGFATSGLAAPRRRSRPARVRLRDESLALHADALAHTRMTLGDYHHRVADLSHRLGARPRGARR